MVSYNIYIMEQFKKNNKINKEKSMVLYNIYYKNSLYTALQWIRSNLKSLLDGLSGTKRQQIVLVIPTDVALSHHRHCRHPATLLQWPGIDTQLSESITYSSYSC